MLTVIHISKFKLIKHLMNITVYNYNTTKIDLHSPQNNCPVTRLDHEHFMKCVGFCVC